MLRKCTLSRTRPVSQQCNSACPLSANSGHRSVILLLSENRKTAPFGRLTGRVSLQSVAVCGNDRFSPLCGAFHTDCTLMDLWCERLAARRLF
jgi:hypothetical protein